MPFDFPMLSGLAARNVRRHSRRTALTAATVFLGTALLAVALAWVNGVAGDIQRESARSTGHVRIVSAAYAKREALRPLYDNLPNTAPLVKHLSALPEVTGVYPRIELPVVASVSAQGKDDVGEIGDVYGLVVGAPLAYYTEVLDLQDHLASGHFFTTSPAGHEPGRAEALVGVSLARSMEVKAGEEAIFIGRTQDGSLSPIKVRVAGLVDTGNGLYDRRVYVPLATARWMADMDGGATELLVYGSDFRKADALANTIRPMLEGTKASDGGALVAQAWDERQPFASIVQIGNTISGAVSGIVVFVTALGVLNTMLMSVLERTHEVGVLRALGMSVSGVVLMFVMEGVVIALAGGSLGAVVGTSVALLMQHVGLDLGSAASQVSSSLPINRVLHADWEPVQTAQVFGLSLLMALVGSVSPALRAARIQPVEAMRSRR